VAGHDHWEDLRYLDRLDNVPMRNMIVATGTCANHNQLPGFNTFEIDSSFVPKSLVMTSLDITKAYGKDIAPPLEDLTTYTLDFEKEYGIKDLTIDSIKKHL
jgi:hypothetical protein